MARCWMQLDARIAIPGVSAVTCDIQRGTLVIETLWLHLDLVHPIIVAVWWC